MLVKIYAYTWIVGLAAAGLFYLTGNFTPIVEVVFGFLTFAAIFMGMISVLPFWATHHSTNN